MLAVLLKDLIMLISEVAHPPAKTTAKADVFFELPMLFEQLLIMLMFWLCIKTQENYNRISVGSC